MASTRTRPPIDRTTQLRGQAMTVISDAAVEVKRWFAVTTWTAEPMDKRLAINRINGHIIGLVFRLPDGVAPSGKRSHHTLSIGRYCKHGRKARK